MTIIIHHHHYHDKGDADRLCRMEEMLGTITEKMETIIMSFQDLNDALAAADAKADAIKADVQTLMDKLAAIPAGGMTPEQEAALADAVAHANAINEKLGAINAMNP